MDENNYIQDIEIINEFVTESREHLDKLEPLLLEFENNPENILINKEIGKVIEAAVNKLPEKRKEIFLMHRFDNLTYSEIAKALDISLKTVETQMSRALKYLRKSLSNLKR